ncbi:murein biosynthesis integral membrane protein MurJ [Tomitella cavernea]|uniref:murein biosynthesis integral membrane protein MurJ n=2 Tax=Tomitella cavernea TaxID=1387982 RepID=UPI001F5BD006|nr:murein biosynthesis integral membrane protein MurJ [Tomitella cavernea]
MTDAHRHHEDGSDAGVRSTPGAGPDTSGTRSGGSRPSVLASTGSMAIATLISRITGFFKVLLTAAVLGPAMASAFTVSNTLPNLVSELVLGAVLTAIVIPVLVRAEREDADGGAAFMRRLFTVAMTIFGIATVVSVAAAPWLSQLMVGDDSEVNLGLSTAFAYLLLPQIIFYGAGGLLTAILNTRSVFKPGAWAPVANNVVAITVLVLFAVMPGEITLNPVDMGTPKLLVLGIGTSLGVLCQAAVLVPAIRRQRIDLRPLWGIDPRLKKFAGMAVAIIVYVAISQVGMVITTRIAADADAAGPAIYNFVWLLLQVPYGILGVTLLTAVMPQLSRNAAAGDNRAVVDDLTMSTKLTMLALLPVVMFFTFDGPGIGRALFNYGAFGGDSATLLGITLSASAFTLIPYAMVLLQLRVFYAREEAWTPTFIIIGIMAVKTALSLFAPVLVAPEHVVIALGTANGLGFVAGVVVGGYLLRRSLGHLNLASILHDSMRILFASAVGVAAMLILELLTGLHEIAGRGRGLVSVMAVSVDGVVMLTVTVLVLSRMRIPMVDQVGRSLARVLVRVLPGAVTPARLRRAAAADTAVPEGRPHDGPAQYREDFDGTRGGDGPAGALPPGGAGARGGRYVPPPGHGPLLPEDPYAGDPVRSRRPVPREPLFSGPGQPLPDLFVPYSGFDTTTYDPLLPRVDAALRKLQVTETHAAAQRAGSGSPQRGPRLIPGAMVAGGRYRLLVRHGGTRGLQFWKALDTRLDREVALTFIDPDGARTGTDPSTDPDSILTRTLRLGKINAPGLARVLDVVRSVSGGIVVSEWTDGSPLSEVAATDPPPDGAARAVAVLASAAEQAHRAGAEMCIDHPDRIRITPDGAAVLAFPATLPGVDHAEDVHGLGATLYALLTNEWPASKDDPAGEVGGFRTALLGAQGLPTEPHVVRTDIPFEISAVAMRAIQGNSGIRTAATVQHVLEQAANAPTPPPPGRRFARTDRGARGEGRPVDAPVAPEDGRFAGHAGETEHAAAAPDRPRSPDAPHRTSDEHTGRIPAGGGQSPPRRTTARPRSLLLDDGPKGPSRRTMSTVLVALAVAVIAVVIFVMVQVGDVFGGGSDAPLTQQNIGLNPTTTAASTTEQAPAPPPPPASVTAKPVNIAVYSPQGVPDDPRGAPLAIDGDPGTQWSTDQYFQQLPALKNGVGLMAEFDRPVKVMKVGIDSPTPGTHVEIRTAPGPNASIAQTRLIASGQLGGGHTEIAVDPPTDQASTHVLVWLTELGPAGSRFQSKITEVQFTVAE